MKKISFLRIIDLLQTLLCYGSLLIIPLSVAFLFPLFSPFVLIKLTWFYVLGALFLIVVLISFRLDKKRLQVVLDFSFWQRILPLLFILIAFFVINIFSVNFQQSFFGSYHRQLGLLFYFWLLIWLILIIYYFHSFLFSHKDPLQSWLRGVRNSAIFIVLSSSLVSIYAFFQYVGYDLILWQEPQLLTRSISSLGQPNFLGSFLLFGLAMSAYLFYLYNNFRQRSLLFILIVLQVVALIFSGSRSAWLALIGALIILGCLFLWNRFRYKTIIFSLIFFLVASFSFYLLSPERALSVLDWKEGSISLRVSFYQVAPKIIAQNPFFGVGLENGGEEIIKHYHPDWGLFMKIDSYSDKIHNNLLDITIQTGFWGLLFYLLLHIFLFKQWLALWRHKMARPFALAAGSGLLAYGITLFFGLSDIANIFYFWFLAALIIAGNIILNNQTSPKSLFFKKLKETVTFRTQKSGGLLVLGSVLSALLFIIALSQIYFSFSVLKADHYFFNFYKQSLNKEYFAADLLYSYVLEDAVNPINLSYYQRAYASFIVGNFNENFDFLSRRLLRSRAADLSLALSATNYEDIYNQAKLKCFLEGAESAQGDFNHLKALSPNRPLIFVDQGNCESSNPDKAILLYGEALERLPNANDHRLKGEHFDYLKFYSYVIHSKLAHTYYKKQEYNEALSFYKQAYFFNPQDLSLLKNIAASYFYLGDYDKAYLNLEHAYSRQDDYYWLSQLAALSMALDDRELANEYWQRITNPVNEGELESLDNLIFP